MTSKEIYKSVDNKQRPTCYALNTFPELQVIFFSRLVFIFGVVLELSAFSAWTWLRMASSSIDWQIAPCFSPKDFSSFSLNYSHRTRD